METFKRYALSSVITFLSAFVPILIVGLGSVDYSQAAITSLVLVAVRAGFKSIGETLAGKTADPKY
jgi:hypothetical protein